MASLMNTAKSSSDKAKDIINDSGFNNADQVVDTVKASLRTAQDTAMEYADKAVTVAKKNPLYFAAGAAGLGLLIGGLLMRNKRRH